MMKTEQDALRLPEKSDSDQKAACKAAKPAGQPALYPCGGNEWERLHFNDDKRDFDGKRLSDRALYLALSGRF